MRRVLDLAARGAGRVSPNPMVGALLVQDGRILGAGWHQRCGGPHAEIHALEAVRPTDRHLIPHSTLYCNLEPCFHQGRTPPCVDRILSERIKTVVIANTDPNPRVAGQSIQRMRDAGIDVIERVLETEGAWLNRVFFTWMARQRPYVVLKWAQSADGFISREGERTDISGPVARRLVHRMRGLLDAVLVGGRTAWVDNPRLDTRFFPGRQPLRIALDARGTLPDTHHLLDDARPTLLLGPARQGSWQHTRFEPVPLQWDDLLAALSARNCTSLMVEGGADVLGQFIKANLWDEAWVLEHPDVRLAYGVPAPFLSNGACRKEVFSLGADLVQVWTNPRSVAP
jgi:diaminohydroxyphosphoribosylaminopyrimidine deaminase/5-amino-6-(5-phosphoribosylamino)uracil reductase